MLVRAHMYVLWCVLSVLTHMNTLSKLQHLYLFDFDKFEQTVPDFYNSTTTENRAGQLFCCLSNIHHITLVVNTKFKDHFGISRAYSHGVNTIQATRASTLPKYQSELSICFACFHSIAFAHF